MRHKLVQRIVAAYDEHAAAPGARAAARATGAGDRATACSRSSVIGAALPERARRQALRARAARPGSTTATSRVEFVDAERIAELNREHRGKDGPDRRALVPGRRATGPCAGAARARRRRDLPGAHRGPDRGGRPRRAAPRRAWTTRPTTARCSRCRREIAGRAERDGDPLGLRRARRPAERRQVDARQRDRRAQKVAIVSDKPQTTRRAIRGVATRRDDLQLVLTDLPGVQRPRDALTERMQRRVEHELARGRRRAVRAQRRAGRRRRRRPLHRRGARAAPKRPGRDRRQQGRPARPRPRTVAALQAAAELGARRARSSRSPRARARASARWSSTSPALLPEGPFYFPPEERLRPARGRAARRAGARAGAAPHAPGGPARGRGRRSRRSSERDDGLIAVRALAVGRDRVPEGHPDRRRRAR